MLRTDGMEEKIPDLPSPKRANRLADWLTPARVAMVAVLGSIPVKLLSDRLADPDLWWHLRTGRLIVEHGIPRSDVYSFTVQGRPWVTQEWLPEVFLRSAPIAQVLAVDAGGAWSTATTGRSRTNASPILPAVRYDPGASNNSSFPSVRT